MESVHLAWRKVAINKMVLSGTIASYRATLQAIKSVKKLGLMEMEMNPLFDTIHGKMMQEAMSAAERNIIHQLFDTIRAIMQDPHSHVIRWTDPKDPMYNGVQDIERLRQADVKINAGEMMQEAMTKVISAAERKIIHQKRMLSRSVSLSCVH